MRRFSKMQIDETVGTRTASDSDSDGIECDMSYNCIISNQG